MPRLREKERIQVLLQLSSGVSVSDVARQFKCHRKTVLHLRQRYEGFGSVQDQPRTDSPRITTVRQHRFITLSHLRFKTATSTATDMGINRQPVVNRLRHNGQPLQARRPCVGQILTHRHRNAWARHVRWTVLCGPEYFSMISPGSIEARLTEGERFAQNYLLERNRFGGGSVMVWEA